MVYSGLTNKSALLYDSLQTESVPFEGLLSDGHTIRIEFMSDQARAVSAFNIRFEGEDPGGAPPVSWSGQCGSRAEAGPGRWKPDLLRMGKRQCLDGPLDFHRPPLWCWESRGSCSHFKYENRETREAKCMAQGPSAGQLELEHGIWYPFSLGIP